MITRIISDGSIIQISCDGIIGPRPCSKTQNYIAADYAAATGQAIAAGWKIEDRLTFCKKCARPVGWPDGSPHK